MMAPAPSTTPHPAILYALPKDRVAGSLGDLVIKAQDEALRNEPSSLWPSLVVRWRKLWSMGSTVEMKSNGIDDGLNRIKLNLKDQPFTVDGTQVDYTTRRSISLNHQNQSQAGTKPPKSLTSCKITSPLMGPSRGVALVEQIENSWGSTSSVKFLGPNLLKSRTMINRGYLLVGHGKIILVC
ncbi:hypothetical protein Pst134EB_010888 [Puccinia striiformis f. sp. tritici]|nr:hypothetical protein Pst134EB_010888 [Puccinia striiformis f. sp. tritici]